LSDASHPGIGIGGAEPLRLVPGSSLATTTTDVAEHALQLDV
jgi:hypothetical protein